MSVDARSSLLPPPPDAEAAPSGISQRGFLDRLDRRASAVRTSLCLGVDPDPAALPRGFAADAEGGERFARLLIEAAAPYAAAVKVNVAFFEAFGSAGIAALERVRAAVPSDIPFIADAKRGDISSTVARQAAALFDSLGADAVTANPYLGREAITPLLERRDRFVYVLCRTSNPGAAEFQALRTEDGQPLYVTVARHVAGWAEGGDQVGLVVGATAPAELADIRRAAMKLPILVPGVGAQGGDIEAVLQHGPATDGVAAQMPAGALLVNVSRGIASAGLDGSDPRGAIATRAQEWAGRLQIHG
jgi:orotidine-5'-phosphate decarboxylase